ncbi:cytochrome P450 [Pseudomonadales bacterium]|nr:cytochrome P450 [Pseudomonadales bacterium]
MSEHASPNPDSAPIDVDIPDPYSLPLHEINVAQPSIFQQDAQWDYFKRLREEDPVHYCADSGFGPYWSVTKFQDIVKVDTDFHSYSSAQGITIGGLGGVPTQQPEDGASEKKQQWDGFGMFIAMDPPKHDLQRATVASAVAPPNLAVLEGTIRERAATILDSLPRGEAFNWVDLVSIELTTQMLATLFDFPFEDRRKLTRWSDIATTPPGVGIVESGEQKRAELIECLQYFTQLWNTRAAAPPQADLISMLAHGKDTKDMGPFEFLGNLLLLIVGGNDTTRNSISGGVLFLNQNPKEYEKLRGNLELIPNMVSEIIRYQTPLAHMRRTALVDTELGGKKIKAGDKLVMWYVSGNRDSDVIPNADAFLIDRTRARHHLSFGFGIHRCMGNRLAEMQLRILWEEISKRFSKVEVVAEPKRTYSTFVKGYTELMVKVHEL